MTMRLLALCGSLRAKSSNRTLLEGAAALTPDGVTLEIYEGIAELPQFNPDIEDENQPDSVTAFREALTKADGVVISSPEYAHGVPGALKNALDWVVGTSELVEKPIALFNAFPRSTYAVAQLSETLTVMSGRLIDDAHVTVQMAGREIPEGGVAADRELAPILREALARFVAAIKGLPHDS